jgi:hypothetical protein
MNTDDFLNLSLKGRLKYTLIIIKMQSLPSAPDGIAEQASRRYTELWNEAMAKLENDYPLAQAELKGTDYRRDIDDVHKRMLNLARYYITDVATQKNLLNANVCH